MAELMIHDIDDVVIERLLALAKTSGRSLEEEIKVILEATAAEPRALAAAFARQFRAQFGERTFADGADLIREDRDR